MVEFGKASTSLLQRRLRIGYGRAAHLIDLMEQDGIVGAADGPKPREVLKRPDWISEIEEIDALREIKLSPQGHKKHWGKRCSTSICVTRDTSNSQH